MKVSVDKKVYKKCKMLFKTKNNCLKIQIKHPLKFCPVEFLVFVFITHI